MIGSAIFRLLRHLDTPQPYPGADKSSTYASATTDGHTEQLSCFGRDGARTVGTN